MSATLEKICESLRTHYGHHELWLDWRTWPVRQQLSEPERQPVVTSCSGRPLAAWSGSGESWSFLLDRTQLRFNNDGDCYRPARNTDNFLDGRRIAELKEKYHF
ncbi:TPA: hypothetical protein ACOEB8_004213 [Enterobacter ludwigii]|nr:hypothetical protein [Enterobacter ludwigii]HDS4679288.1 hypothetical protein [Enterobacter ludwigii]